MGVIVHGGGAPLQVDVAVDRRLPSLTHASARHVMIFGSGIHFVGCAAVLIAVALALRDRYAAAVAAIVAPLALVLTEWIGKPLVHRAEPAGLGYPSGHVTGTAVLAAVVLLVGYRRWGGRSVVALGPVAISMTASMAIAVIRLQFHYFTDTVAGAMVGCGTVAAVAAATSYWRAGPVTPSAPAVDRVRPGPDAAPRD